jgi:hypothetical protein
MNRSYEEVNTESPDLPIQDDDCFGDLSWLDQYVASAPALSHTPALPASVDNNLQTPATHIREVPTMRTTPQAPATHTLVTPGVPPEITQPMSSTLKRSAPQYTEPAETAKRAKTNPPSTSAGGTSGTCKSTRRSGGDKGITTVAYGSAKVCPERASKWRGYGVVGDDGTIYDGNGEAVGKAKPALFD